MIGITWGGSNWAEIITALGTVLIGSGIFFAGSQVREARNSRHADIAIRFAERWHEDPLVQSREAAAEFPTAIQLRDEVKRASKVEQTKFHLLLRVPNFFEEVAAAEKFGWITVEWICSTWGSGLAVLWETWLPTVEFLRQPDGSARRNARIYQDFERIKNVVMESLDSESPPTTWRRVQPLVELPSAVLVWPWSRSRLRF